MTTLHDQSTTHSHRSLQGQVALVTGTGRGLGGTIAQAMARQGASLVICDVDREALDATQAPCTRKMPPASRSNAMSPTAMR